MDACHGYINAFNIAGRSTVSVVSTVWYRGLKPRSPQVRVRSIGQCHSTSSSFCQMDTTTSHGASSSLPIHLSMDDTLALVSPLQQSFQRSQRLCLGNSAPGEFPLSANPSIVLHVLTSCNLDPDDLAHLEASNVCTFLCYRIDIATDGPSV